MDGLSLQQLCPLLRWLKDGPPGSIAIEHAGKSLGYLRAVTWEDAGDRVMLEQLTRWHETTFAWFPEPFPVTPASVRNWLVRQVLQTADRVLFWISDAKGEAVGHIGLSHFEAKSRTMRLTDQVCSHPGKQPLMQAAKETLVNWAFESLQVEALSSAVLGKVA